MDKPPNIAKQRGLRAEFYGRPTDKALLEAMVAALERGELQPFAGSVFPLADVQTAYVKVATGHGLGRVVLVDGDDKGRDE